MTEMINAVNASPMCIFSYGEAEFLWTGWTSVWGPAVRAVGVSIDPDTV